MSLTLWERARPELVEGIRVRAQFGKHLEESHILRRKDEGSLGLPPRAPSAYTLSASRCSFRSFATFGSMTTWQ